MSGWLGMVGLASLFAGFLAVLLARLVPNSEEAPVTPEKDDAPETSDPATRDAAIAERNRAATESARTATSSEPSSPAPVARTLARPVDGHRHVPRGTAARLARRARPSVGSSNGWRVRASAR